MYRRVALVSVLCVGSVHAMEHGQTLQIVVNTPVAKTLRWLSSGRPEANIAAGAIAVCLAKSGFDIVTWPMRAWWGRAEEHSEKSDVSGCTSGCQSGESSDMPQMQSMMNRLAALEKAPIAEDKKLEDFVRRLTVLEGRPSVTVHDISALRTQVQALGNADDITTLGNRVAALEGKAPHLDVASVESDARVEARMNNLETKFSAFEKQNSTEHASIRKDNLSMFTQALEKLTGRVSVTESQLKALQERAQLITSVKQ